MESGNKIRLILSDLDHTLLRQDGSVSGETLRVLDECRNKGILFAIATARYWIGAEKYIDLLRPDYEITTDGTLIHSDNECLYSCEFSVENTNFIVKSLLNLCGRGVAVANAVPEALAAADEVTLSNDENGVAHWLEANCINI